MKLTRYNIRLYIMADDLHQPMNDGYTWGEYDLIISNSCAILFGGQLEVEF